MTVELKKTVLHDWHVQNGGRMVPFAGWEMPVQYPSGPRQEHEVTRTIAGLFDIDHMGQMEVRGPEAEAFVNQMVTYDVKQMKLWDAHYSVLCYADGTCVDDIFIYKLPDVQKGGDTPYFFIAINASNREKDIQWFVSHSREWNVTIKDISDETYMLAFQGPKAVEILDRLVKSDLNQVPRFTAARESLFGVDVLLGRTGYTGEDGFELYFSADQAVKVWEGILEAGKRTVFCRLAWPLATVCASKPACHCMDRD
jgi:aminomethyltransferase